MSLSLSLSVCLSLSLSVRLSVYLSAVCYTFFPHSSYIFCVFLVNWLKIFYQITLIMTVTQALCVLALMCVYVFVYVCVLCECLCVSLCVCIYRCLFSSRRRRLMNRLSLFAVLPKLLSNCWYTLWYMYDIYLQAITIYICKRDWGNIIERVRDRRGRDTGIKRKGKKMHTMWIRSFSLFLSHYSLLERTPSSHYEPLWQGTVWQKWLKIGLVWLPHVAWSHN